MSSSKFVKGTPDWIKSAIEVASKKYGISTMILSALINQESSFNPQAVSSAGAIGLGQFMPGTARGMGIDPYNWQQSVDGAARYLKQNLDMFGGDMQKALAAYNAGPGAVQQYGGVPPFAETQKYVRNIMSAANESQTESKGIQFPTLPDIVQQAYAEKATPSATDYIPQQGDTYDTHANIPTSTLSGNQLFTPVTTPSNQYTVQGGDTLWGIAQNTLGAGNRWRELQGYSGNPTQMPIGTHVTIPTNQPAPNTSTHQGAVYTPPPTGMANTSTRQGPVYTPPAIRNLPLSFSPQPGSSAYFR